MHTCAARAPRHPKKKVAIVNTGSARHVHAHARHTPRTWYERARGRARQQRHQDRLHQRGQQRLRRDGHAAAAAAQHGRQHERHREDAGQVGAHSQQQRQRRVAAHRLASRAPIPLFSRLAAGITRSGSQSLASMAAAGQDQGASGPAGHGLEGQVVRI